MKGRVYTLLGFLVWKITKGYVQLRWSPAQRRAAAGGAAVVAALAIGLAVKAGSGAPDDG